MNFTLKEMAQIEKARKDAEVQETKRINEERLNKQRKLRDALLVELREFIPNVISGRYVRPSVFIPLKGFRAEQGYGYDIFPLDEYRFEVKKHSNSCCLKDSWTKEMTHKELATIVLIQYV